mgnify:CR=1 FL=1
MRPHNRHFDEKTIRYHQAVKKISRFLSRNIYFIALAICFMTVFLTNFERWTGIYSDADGYMRAIRLKQWIQNFSFWEQPIPQSNYPYGDVLHWTRPMDILWLLCYLPFSFIYPLKDAIFIGGAFLSPMIQIFCALALIYGLKRHFNIYLVILALFLFLNHFIGIFTASRPDHHSLMNLWLICATSLSLCWLKKRKDRYLTRLGIVLALGVFTAIEGMFLYAGIIAFYLYLHVFQNISLHPATKTAKSFAFTLSIFWLLNPPYQGWFYPDNGRISILFVCTAWLAYMGLWILEKAHIHKWSLKILNLLCMASGFALVLLTIFGADIFASPLTPEITTRWLRYNLEMQPFYKLKPDMQLYFYGFPLLALILNIYLLRIRRYRRIMLLNLCIGLPLFLLSLHAIRFANYQCVYSILPLISYVDYLYKKSAYAKNINLDFPIYIWGVILGFFLLQGLIAMPYSITLTNKKTSKDFSPALCQQIKEIGGTLVTDVFVGPLYIWHCDINVIGTPYHRNISGIMETYQILSSPDDAEIVPLLLKHQATQILVFDKYKNEFSQESKNSLYNRLIQHQNIPFYLEEVPTDFATAHLYRIKI